MDSATKPLGDVELSFDMDIATESGDVQTKTFNIRFIVDAQQITLSKWAAFETMLTNLPINIKVHLGLKKLDDVPIHNRSKVTKWTSQTTNQYAHALLDMLACFAADESKAFLLSLKQLQYDEMSEVSHLHRVFCGVYNSYRESHTPTARRGFKHKGKQYVVPYDDELIGNMLNWGEATEALQSLNYLKKEKGVQAKDGLLMHSLRVLASICRETKQINKSGVFKIVAPPSRTEDWAEYLRNREKELADLPCSIMQDVGFFLTNSLSSSLNIHSLELLLNNRLYSLIAS